MKVFMSISKQILIFIVQVFCCAVCFAQPQTIDNLKKDLPSLRDTSRIDCLNALSQNYIYLQPDTAKIYALQAYTEALKINYLRGMAKAFSNCAYVEGKAIGHFPVAEDYGRKAIELYKKTNDEKGLIDAYIIWSFSLMAQGSYDSSIIGDMKAIELCKKINYKVMEARAITQIAINYLEGGNYAKAIEYSMEGVKVARQSKDSDRITVSLAIAGNLYSYAGDTKTALSYYFESLKYAKGTILFVHPFVDIGDAYYLRNQYDSAIYFYKLQIDTIKSIKAETAVKHGAGESAMSGIGEIFLAKKQYDSALIYFKVLLNIAKKGSDNNQVMRLLFDIGKTYYGKKDYKVALVNARGSLLLANKFRAKQFMRDGNELMFLIYDKFKQTDSAYYYYRNYTDMKDSVALESFNRKLDLYKAVTEDEKKQVQIKTLNSEKLISRQQVKLQQQQIKSETLRRNILIAAILILLLLGIFVLRYNIIKRRNEKLQLENKLQLQQLESEKTKAELQQQTTELEMQALRAQMNPHFIFNCLNSINRFIINNDAVKAADYLTKFAKLIRIVLEQSGKSFVTLEDEISCLKLYMDLEALRFERPFKYEIDLNGTDVSIVMIPTMLIQPFVENAIWHGLHPKQNGIGEININMHQQENTLHCSICDNGVGRAKDNTSKQDNWISKKSLGVNITQHRLQLIDSAKQQGPGIEIHDLMNEQGHSSGTCVDIKIPLKEM